MSRAEKHLTIEQIERLIEVQPGQAGGAEDAELLTRARQHLTSCESCRGRVSMHDEFARKLGSLRATRDLRRNPDCPAESETRELASGLLPAEQSDRILAHVLSCDFCGHLLRQTMEDFEERVSPEEETVIASLPSARWQWQNSLAARLGGSTDRNRSMPKGSARKGSFHRILRMWPRWIPVGTAALALAIVTPWLLRRGEVQRVNRLLAQAYTQDRTLEPRIPGADRAPLSVTRGPGRSRQDIPAALLEAEAKIAERRLERNQDVDWLIASARADILEWNYDAAIRTLREAAARAPKTPKVNLDLATAYFERAEATGHFADYGAAADLVSAVLASDSSNTVALFNRALIFEKLSLYSQAQADWKHYLALDPSGDWSREARDHLLKIQQQLNEKGSESENGALRGPELVAGSESSAVLDHSLDSRIEEYQRAVLTTWGLEFVKSNPQSQRDRSMMFGKAVDHISRLMVTRHDDVFFRDLFFNTRRGPKLERAVLRLAQAMSANETGNEQEAMVLSRKSERDFRAISNPAGALRALFEQVYAEQFSSQVVPCQRNARAIARDSHVRGYKWLEAQALIELGYCANMDGNLGVATRKLSEAADVAKKAAYEETLERAMVGNAAMQWQRGSVSLAWALALEGLNRFWSHPVSNVRGASLLAVLDLIADETEQWHLQEAVLKESIPLVDRGKDRLASAQTHSRLAASELMLGQYRDAESDLGQSMQLFRAAPQTAPTRIQFLTVAVNMAKVEMQRHQFERSWVSLQSLQPMMEELHENLSLLHFYSTLGEVSRNLGRDSEAGSADRKAIAIFQSSLAGISDARDRLTWFREASLAYRSMVQLQLNHGDTLNALETWENYRDTVSSLGQNSSLSAPASSNGTRPSENSSESQPVPLQKHEAEHHEKHLIYASLPGGLFAWVRDRDGSQAVRINDSSDDIALLKSIFIEECSAPSSQLRDVLYHGRELYQQLILPFSRVFSPDDTIVIEPDEALADLPFGALVDETGEFFGARHRILISTGSRRDSGARAIHQVNAEDPVLLVVAAGIGAGKELHDPLAEEEARAIALLFRNPTIVAASAVPNEGFEKLLAGALIFHYAGHSRTTVSGGELSVFVRDQLGSIEPSSMKSQDIVKHYFRHCRLVVLSACETNRGEEGRWLDRENLALTFLNAGVPEVVASLWSVDSNATTVMMKEFYSSLLSGATTSEALRLAAAKMRSTPGFLHPYYWAAFSVQTET